MGQATFFCRWIMEILPQYTDPTNYDSDYISGLLTVPIEKQESQSANRFLCFYDPTKSISYIFPSPQLNKLTQQIQSVHQGGATSKQRLSKNTHTQNLWVLLSIAHSMSVSAHTHLRDPEGSQSILRLSDPKQRTRRWPCIVSS